MKNSEYKRIMFAGPSGIGKTTIAKTLSEKTGIPFVSGSVSDLIPDTKDMTHEEMLSRDSTELYMEDFQILNLRNKIFSSRETFISDRSFIDSLSYFILKQADKQPKCEIENFQQLCQLATVKTCDLLIFLPLKVKNINNWVVEDNKKRVTNPYFQAHISDLMQMSLELMGYSDIMSYASIGNGLFKLSTPLTEVYTFGSIKSVYGKTDVLIIPNLPLEERIQIIEKYL